MVVWWIIGAILVLLLIVLLLRVGITIAFGEKLYVAATVGPIKIDLMPAPEKKRKRAKASKKREKEGKKPLKETDSEEEKKAPRPTFRELRPALPVFWEALKKALRKTRRRMLVHPMQLAITFGGEDPAQLAQVYGWANSAMWVVMPQLEQLLQIPDPHIHLEADFERQHTSIEGTVGLRFRVGDLLSIVLTMAVPVLRWYMKWKKQPAVKEEPTTTTQNAQSVGKESYDGKE